MRVVCQWMNGVLFTDGGEERGGPSSREPHQDRNHAFSVWHQTIEYYSITMLLPRPFPQTQYLLPDILDILGPLAERIVSNSLNSFIDT